MGHPLFCSPQRGHHLKTKPLLLTEQVTKAELSKDLLDHIKFLSHDKANQMSQECKLENPGTRNGCREVIGGEDVTLRLAPKIRIQIALSRQCFYQKIGNCQEYNLGNLSNAR